MSTYDFDKILTEYANGRMSVEMTLGHALQHIGKLYTSSAALATGQREQTASLTETIQQLRADVDSLIAHTGNAAARSGQATGSQNPLKRFRQAIRLHNTKDLCRGLDGAGLCI